MTGFGRAAHSELVHIHFAIHDPPSSTQLAGHCTFVGRLKVLKDLAGSRGSIVLSAVIILHRDSPAVDLARRLTSVDARLAIRQLGVCFG